VIVEPKASPETRPVKTGGGHRAFVSRTPITATHDITDIKLAGDAYDTQVQLKFTPAAARRLHDATTNQSGLHIAFVVDDVAMSAVTWTGPYGMDADLGVQLSLGKPVPEVRRMVEAIQGCIGSGNR
jgi:preprotein translocase subunit SecD